MARQLTQKEYHDWQVAMAFGAVHLYFFWKDTGIPADKASDDEILLHWANSDGAAEFAKEYTVGSK